MAEPLLGRVAVVTGVGQGIGREIGRTLTAHGARFVLADIDGAAARDGAAEIDAIGVECEVTSEQHMHRLVSETVCELGHLDVFVNSAGITRDASLKKMSVSDFDAVVAVHLRGTWLGVREASAVMREQRNGSIINISSQRAGETSEVAGAVVFRASALSSYVTGAVIEVGGGRYM